MLRMNSSSSFLDAEAVVLPARLDDPSPLPVAPLDAAGLAFFVVGLFAWLRLSEGSTPFLFRLGSDTFAVSARAPVTCLDAAAAVALGLGGAAPPCRLDDFTAGVANAGDAPAIFECAIAAPLLVVEAVPARDAAGFAAVAGRSDIFAPCGECDGPKKFGARWEACGGATGVVLPGASSVDVEPVSFSDKEGRLEVAEDGLAFT